MWSRVAHRRISEQLPDVRTITVVRDPIDRASSNWMRLVSDGLEPEADFETASALQDERVTAGWAPFWRYRELGCTASSWPTWAGRRPRVHPRRPPATACCALQAVIDRDPACAVRELDEVLPRAAALGGCAAQRDVLEETLVYSLARSGQGERAASLLDGRLARRRSPLGDDQASDGHVR